MRMAARRAPTLVCTGTAKKNYNDVDTSGARVALKVGINDDWSISPTMMGQQTIANGNSPATRRSAAWPSPISIRSTPTTAGFRPR